MNFKSLTLTYGNVAVALPSNRYPLPSVLGYLPHAEHHINLSVVFILSGQVFLSSLQMQANMDRVMFFLLSVNNHVSHVT